MKTSFKNRVSDTLSRVIYNDASAIETFVIGIGIAVIVFCIGYLLTHLFN